MATQWLVTLHLMSSLRETAQLATEYSRLIDAVHETRDLGLLASSPTPVQVEDDAIAGPLWLDDTRRVVADPSSATGYPQARLLHRAHLVVTCDGDPTPRLPTTQLPGMWVAEPLV